MIEKKDYSLMTNNEIQLWIMNLKNLFESKKNEIKKACDELEMIDSEYNKAQNELNIRGNSIY